jgi:hypothetical protein
LSHAIETTRGVFGRHNGDVQLLSELDVIIQILFHERVFIPEIVEGFDGTADTYSVCIAVRPHGIQHQYHVVADGLTHRLANFDVVSGDGMWMDLVCRPSHGLKVFRFFAIGLWGWEIG